MLSALPKESAIILDGMVRVNHEYRDGLAKFSKIVRCSAMINQELVTCVVSLDGDGEIDSEYRAAKLHFIYKVDVRDREMGLFMGKIRIMDFIAD